TLRSCSRTTRSKLTSADAASPFGGVFTAGRFDAPKSRYGRRSIPLSAVLARRLWPLAAGRSDDDLVFPPSSGSPLDDENVRARVLKPAAVEAAFGEWVYVKGRRVPRTWVGFHTFRHTCATLLFRHGLNAKQVRMWLGHHSPAFTLEGHSRGCE